MVEKTAPPQRRPPGYRVFFLLELNKRLGRLQIPIFSTRIGQAEETVRQWLYRESVPDEHWEAIAPVFECKDDRELLDHATKLFQEYGGDFPRPPVQQRVRRRLQEAPHHGAHEEPLEAARDATATVRRRKAG